ncbi:MAG TPA: 3-phosphoshikimate 1-carboxyvinyltransferase [Bacteroidia bacterium]|jgi:3-phosphoshikimate 1-carboxyvinyltransferase|nr:3-phosphoshikimate 1-carboxyvinyltransferase [Bacteroidia bacterium]
MTQATKTIATVHPLVKPIEAKVQVPGSKSFTNRALIVAALADGITTLQGASDSNDSRILITLLDRLGVEIIEQDGVVQVRGNGGKFDEFNGVLNVEDAGTVMRFLTALCSIVPGEITIEGSDRMNHRPIKELVDALKKLGAEITYSDNDGYPPIKINGGTINGGNVHVNGNVSSQFVSALLMIAPALSTDTEIVIDGEQVSEPYIDMTTSVMKEFGMDVEKSGKHYFVGGNKAYKGTKYKVEGDASAASYMLAIAALTQSKIAVTNVSANSLQSDARFVKILKQMGCTVGDKEYLEVTGTNTLKAIEVNMQTMPDTAQTLAVLAAFAKGETIITGLKTLQLKESKRITALQMELEKMGIECEAGNDFIKIKGGAPKAATISTYSDHRMAMAFAIAGMKVEGIGIESPEVVKKSYPGFWEALKSIGVNVEMK